MIMKSENLMLRLLNLGNDWKIKDIIVNKNFREIDIYIEYTASTGLCPTTQKECKIYDYGEERRIRHLDLFEYKTYLNLRVPRVKNGNQEVTTMKLDWAGNRVSYSYLFEAKVIEALSMSKNQTKTADFFKTTFDIVHGIMLRAIERGLLRRNLDGTKALSIDEKSFGNGQQYITILSDPVNKKVLDVVQGRKTDDALELLGWALSPSQLNNISFITMDMWKPFKTAANILVPGAEIIYDKFHITKYLNKAVDGTRKDEVKKRGELKGSKYIFLKNTENWTERQMVKFESIDGANLITSKAWQIKENFKGFYLQYTHKDCLAYFAKWYINTIGSGIKQMVKVADTLLNHLKGIVAAAVTGFTNSVAENLNSQIQVVKTVGRGFANPNAYRNAILFFQGKLNLMPL